jgi:hypothetical protein
MKKKIKKIGYRIGIIPIIIVLSVGLLASGIALAEDEVEPQASATGTVTPNTVLNDGASVLHFTWDIYDWDGTADYYTFQVNVRGQPGSPMYIQYSDDHLPDTFPPADISMDLQNVSGTVGTPTTHIIQPDDPNTHDWTVPDTVAPGLYSAWVNLYLEGQTAPVAGAFIPFSIEQRVEVRKFNDENGNGIKDGGETEITGTWNVQIWDPSMVSIYNGTMPAIIDVAVAGTFTATETLKAGWEVTTPPGSPSVTQTFDIPADKDVVWFGNYQIPPEGDLLIHKYIDTNGDGVDNDGLNGVGWTFNIYGPDNPVALYSSNQTDANGDILLTGMPVGQYKVVETLMAGDPVWKCTDPGAGLSVTVNVLSLTQTDVDFGNQQQGDLLIFKYEEDPAVAGNGVYDGADTPGEGWYFSISGPSGIMNVGPTDVSGHILVQDLIPGSYTVTEKSGPAPPPGFGWVCTDPGPGKTKSGISVPSGGTSSEVQFGNQLIERMVPTLGQWGIIGMSTVFAGLLVWFGVRRRRLAPMK